jgi:polyhydroxyalkanoate synthase subunit PhaC
VAVESPWEVAERAASVLAPESDLFEDTDVAQFGQALGLALRGAAAHGQSSAGAILRFATEVARIPPVALGRLIGADLSPPVEIDARDRRFADPAWSDNVGFSALRMAYLAMSQLSERIIAGAKLDSMTDEKARLAVNLMLDAVAPTNFLPTNPAALKRAFETGGLSVAKGARNFVYDLLNNRGRPRQVDTRPFTKGKNLAATPCKVVYRNELMELLQYEPQTDKVQATPLLCSPPWINKYYVMDLAPGRSFIEWAIRHNRTVFAISYLNPPAEMSGVTMDDYLVHGPQTALDVIQDITGAKTVDIVGLCMGGALTAITAAYLTAAGDTRVGNVTLLNTLLDYSNPGPLGVFTDQAAVRRLEKKMAKKGQLEGASMAGTFDILRANDLIFNYVVSNWLMGQDPPAFDILAWNADSTRMPAAMHAFYLRNFYVHNRLAKGELEIAGQTLDLGAIQQPSYIVGAENDHIVLWESAYKSTGLLTGPTRFVLSSGGHIAGIVNPPGPKGWYLVADSHPEAASEWRSIATKHAGSWWQDWARWSSEQAGELIDPPPMGSATYAVLYAGPGEYINT